MITIKTKFSEYIELCKKHKACQQAIDWMEEVNKNDLTTGEGVTLYVNESNKKCSPAWAVWTLRVLYNEIDDGVRNLFISKIKEPMQAFKLCEKGKHFTEEDYKKLTSKYYKKLPNCEGKICH